MQLSGGTATVTAPQLNAGTPQVTLTTSTLTYGDLLGNEVAALNVDCANEGGTAAGELEDSWVVYGDSGKLRVLGVLTPQQPSGAQRSHTPYFDAQPGMLTVGFKEIITQELWYKADDATCCPSIRATTMWKYANGTFTPDTIVTPSWLVAPSTVDWAAVSYPTVGGCGATPQPYDVQQVGYIDAPTADELAAVLVRCEYGTAKMPSSLFLFDGAKAATSPELFSSLVTATADVAASSVTIEPPTPSGVVKLSVTVTSLATPTQAPTTKGWEWSKEGLITTPSP